MSKLIEHLKQKQWLWHGSEIPQSRDHHSTGYALLDQNLQGGFPLHGVVEIQSLCGIGELRLLLPHMKKSSGERLSVFIQPPGYLCAQQLATQGLDLNQVLLLYPNTEHEALWAAEQCLKSGACSNVLLWHSELEVHQARRLQVASETGHCLSFLLRSEAQRSFSLPVSLSMRLLPHPSGLEICITKRKGGWPHTRFILDMSTRWPSLTHCHGHSVILPFPLKKQG
ncbi:translesion DNA synthesis-associated protein ImuA [Vibrio ostreicida]|uniref:Translesion DNA synthesis-associated protein ImuA n=1 Tax=Vibrio ostreicida TaxID=526588 RepID=A0ABT8BTK8_9VIBR|nr:translesion DNA synthesis-associated protein ImuA [Vibrio ostreicida]MDN3610487.1 translesion DNA synthesis-associated protein ImuA [Vibrio ostreicida]NPD07511.1 translesion DNA synthesis-associated protein ImuA [Vibrio ostreicida]